MGKLNARNKNNYFNELSTKVNDNHLVLLNLMKINLDELNIIYRAEGNANLVLSLPDKRQVLRLRKSNVNEIDTKDTTKSSLKELEECIQYTKFVSSIIGKFLTCEPQLVQLEIANLKNFNNWLLNFRPADRLNKELRCRYGTLYPDVAFLPLRLSLRTMFQLKNWKTTDTFCVEIKPKQGWTFYQSNGVSEFQNNQSLCSDVNKCRYCCMQYLKLEKGKIQQISRYCPIDLFSGIRSRMRHAINGLFYSPQNNLRIFKNKTLIFGDKLDKKLIETNLEEIFGINKTNEERMEIFINLIISILLNDTTNENPSNDFVCNETDIEQNRDQSICKTIDYTILPINSALRRTLDIQLLAKAGLKEILYFNDKQSTSSYIENLLKKYSKENNLFDTKECLEKLNKYEKYLLGATALDCSLMLSFQHITDVEYNSNYDNELKKYTIIENNMKFLSNVTIMDLDPKSTTHYAKYLRQTKASHMAYKNYYKSSSSSSISMSSSIQ